VVAQTLQQRPFVAAGPRQLDERLQHAAEQFVPPQPVFVEVLVHLVNVATLPQLHQTVDAVDDRYRAAAGGFQPERAAAAVVPRLQLDLAAGAGVLGRLVGLLGLLLVLAIVSRVIAPVFTRMSQSRISASSDSPQAVA